MSSKNQRINEQIRVREVRLIDADGKQLGVVPTIRALEMAKAKKVDLVEVAPNAQPPVCRLLDFGKYMYEKTKREREARKAQKIQVVKELRFKPTTDDYHVGFKVKAVRRYLAEGAKVKISIVFRGRAITHPEVGKGQLQKIIDELGNEVIVEQSPKMEGRSMQMLLAPAAPAKPKPSKPTSDGASKPASPAQPKARADGAAKPAEAVQAKPVVESPT